MLVGHVTWQGPPAQPHPLQQLPITLTLKSGATQVEYTGLTTDPSGYFTVGLGTLPSGTYDWWVKGPKYLANSGTTALNVTTLNVERCEGVSKGEGCHEYNVQRSTFNALTTIEMGLMRAGDANDDNVVEVLDFSILKATFGRLHTDPGYDDRADFTGDLLVDTLDFSALKANFGVAGAPPLVP